MEVLITEEMNNCANHVCNCLVSAGKQFCCERCERMENVLETGDCRRQHVERYQEPIP
jgi:hypothetical protein